MFQFAWVAPTETIFDPTHLRMDEDVIAISLKHTEGDFALLDIDIKNPRRYLLQDETDIWAWLAHNETPLFFGRLIAIPENMSEEIVSLSFIARPSNYESTKKELAETLKVEPYWDKVWINNDRVDDPDVVLEARPSLYCIDRLTHEVTISNIYAGEDGTLIYNTDAIIYDSLNITYSNPPLRRVRIEAQLSWDQIAEGIIDISPHIIKAFNDAGSPRTGLISSFTGQGLEADWPENETTLNGGWSVWRTELKRADGVWVSRRTKDVYVDSIDPVAEDENPAVTFVSEPIKIRFFAWDMQPTIFELKYEALRQRIETVKFDLEADIQSVFSDPGEDEVEIISLSSRKISEPEIEPEEGEQPGPPIMGDRTTNAYLKTDRGRRSFEYLLMVARARMLSRARAVEITFQVPFDFGYPLTLRKNVTIFDNRIPDGVASGKIIAYSMEAGSGKEVTTITIGCMVGRGNTVNPQVGIATYVEEDYVIGYQFYEGLDYMPVPNEITYVDYSDTEISGYMEFNPLVAKDVIIALNVINGETIQRDILNTRFPDIPAAIEALNAVFTEVWLELEPVTGGPFETKYNIDVSELMIPRTITL